MLPKPNHENLKITICLTLKQKSRSQIFLDPHCCIADCSSISKQYLLNYGIYSCLNLDNAIPLLPAAKGGFLPPFLDTNLFIAVIIANHNTRPLTQLQGCDQHNIFFLGGGRSSYSNYVAKIFTQLLLDQIWVNTWTKRRKHLFKL